MKLRIFALILMLSLVFCGCGSDPLPNDWDESWTVIAPFLAAEPIECFTFGESDDIMGLSGVYYATWINGDARDYTNSEGEVTRIFNSQIYVVAQECRTEADAMQNLTAWIAREKQNYEVIEEVALTVNGRDYTMLILDSGRESNPYGFGCAAFTISGTNAVCVELVCSDTFTGGPGYVLEMFLQSLHYHE